MFYTRFVYCFYFILFFFQAGQKSGLSDEQIKSAVSRIKDQAVKDRLKQYTEEALKYGVCENITIVYVMEPLKAR